MGEQNSGPSAGPAAGVFRIIRSKRSLGAAVLLASFASTPGAAQIPALDPLVVSARPNTNACLPTPEPAPGRSPRTPGAPLRTQVVLLGTGTPIPDPHRSGPAVAVIVDGQAYLVDAGVGLVRQAAASVDGGVLPLATSNLRRVFITHLHSDHTLGLPDLVLTPWVMSRDSALEAWGPEGLLDMTRSLMQAWRKDIRVRLGAEQAGNATGLHTIVCEVPPDAGSAVVYRDRRVVVTAFAVRHGEWNAAPDSNFAYGFRFDTPDLSVVISGDTGPAPEVFERYCNGCDVLVHEVYAMKNRMPLPPERKAYDSAYHTSSVLLANEVAPKARPGLLVLYHLGLMPGVSEQDLLDEVTRRYRGRVCLGHDLDVFGQGAHSPCTPASTASSAGPRLPGLALRPATANPRGRTSGEPGARPRSRR
jgi:ribonuclease BN (tRNA processing enzyme)